MPITEFSPEYDYREITDDHWINRQMVYDDSFYIIIPYSRTLIPFNSNFIFKCFLRKKGEIYGDALVVKEIPEQKTLLVYNGNKLVAKIGMEIANPNLAELMCVFDKWVFKKKGSYKLKFDFSGFIIDAGHEIIVK